jgi:hypothetical protein
MDNSSARYLRNLIGQVLCSEELLMPPFVSAGVLHSIIMRDLCGFGKTFPEALLSVFVLAFFALK